MVKWKQGPYVKAVGGFLYYSCNFLSLKLFQNKKLHMQMKHWRIHPQ